MEMFVMTAPFAAPEPFAADVLAEMRGWISDCVWGDLTPSQIKRMSTARVVDGVRRHYSGGVSQFVSDFYQFGPEPYYR
jgi:hypothetical protein